MLLLSFLRKNTGQFPPLPEKLWQGDNKCDTWNGIYWPIKPHFSYRKRDLKGSWCMESMKSWIWTCPVRGRLDTCSHLFFETVSWDLGVIFILVCRMSIDTLTLSYTIRRFVCRISSLLQCDCSMRKVHDLGKRGKQAKQKLNTLEEKRVSLGYLVGK